MKILKEKKPTKEQFKAFLLIQKSGVTNMFDANTVCKLANSCVNINLTKEHCLYIYSNYDELVNEYHMNLEEV